MKNYSPRLFDLYKNDIQSLLKDKLGINNVMQLPKIEKIVLNMGIGDAKDNKNSLSQAIEEMTIITGQRPVVTKEMTGPPFRLNTILAQNRPKN